MLDGSIQPNTIGSECLSAVRDGKSVAKKRKRNTRRRARRSTTGPQDDPLSGQLNARVPASIMKRIQDFEARLKQERPGARISKTEAIRELLVRGLESVEKEHGEGSE